jgi:AcrR family transcriptional regulator
MEPKRDKILSAAVRLFGQLGFKKVTMGDIAEAAEMSRPTLYAAFPSKEAIVGAIGARQVEHSDAECARRLPRAKTLEARLAVMFDVWITEPFASIVDEPNGLDLLGNWAQYAPEASALHYLLFEERLEELLAPAMSGHVKGGAGMTARDLARILSMATKGLKASTTSLAEMRRLTDGLVATAVAAAGTKR